MDGVNKDLHVLVIEKTMQVMFMSHLEQGSNPLSEQSSKKKEMLQQLHESLTLMFRFYQDVASYNIRDDRLRSNLLTDITKKWLTEDLTLRHSGWSIMCRILSSW